MLIYKVEDSFPHYVYCDFAEAKIYARNAWWRESFVERMGREPFIERLEVQPLGLFRSQGATHLWALTNSKKLVLVEVRLVYYCNQSGGTAVICDRTAEFEMLPKGGQSLIGLLRGSDSGETEIPWEELARVSDYVELDQANIYLAGHGQYANPKIKKLIATMVDGSERVFWSTSVGYFEGYQFDLFASLKAANADFRETELARRKADWIDLECHECGATYVEPGHVEPGAMGCDRCN